MIAGTLLSRGERETGVRSHMPVVVEQEITYVTHLTQFSVNLVQEKRQSARSI
jgi:hypothetical protein